MGHIMYSAPILFLPGHHVFVRVDTGHEKGRETLFNKILLWS